MSGTFQRQQDGVSFSRGLLGMKIPPMPETLVMALLCRRPDTLLIHPLVPTDPTITDIREDWTGCT